MSRGSIKSLRRIAVMVGLISAAPAVATAQQTGTLQGTVIDASSALPLSGVQVYIPETRFATFTNAQGRFLLTGLPAGSHTVSARSIGYSEASHAAVITAGQVTTLNIELTQSAIALGELVVTGVAEATPKALLPITVGQLKAEDLPVPSVSAGSAIQAKVAGVTVMSGTGRPGAEPTILLRAPTSINAAGRDQSPLYIVDGVILASGMADIDALDIENVEIVKGAAAASMYGSRAQAGVVQITTRRGRGGLEDRVRYTARTEYGQSQLPGRFNLTQKHHFAMNEDGTKFLDKGDPNSPCDWLDCSGVSSAGQMRHLQYNINAAGDQVPLSAGSWNTIQREAWPGKTHDHISELFTNGAFQQHYFGVDGRSGATNFHASYSMLDDKGIMPGQEGYQRHNFRLNLDQSVHSKLQFQGSAFYSRSTQNQFPETNGNPIFNLTRMPAGVDLRSCLPGTKDGQGNELTTCAGTPYSLSHMIIRPDPHNENDNPLYSLLHRDYTVNRGRFLGSAQVTWRPIDPISVIGNVSYDRLDYNERDYYPKGYRDIRNTAYSRDGALYRYDALTEGLNASITAGFRHRFGDLNTNTTVRYLWEQEDFASRWTDGFFFRVGDIPEFPNIISDNLTASSSTTPTRSDGYSANTILTYRERYIFDGLIRNDGSSLFGKDQRRQWYYRLSGAWRISEEDFFNLPAVDELKIRYAIGTAGGRPRWSAQYETYSVGSQGISMVTLGNSELRPEKTTEQEVALDATIANRLIASVVYATSNTTDQILNVPQPAYTGFSNRWVNAGALKSSTWEASLDASLIERPDFHWSARILFDRTRQEITELNVPAYTDGVSGQNLGSIFNIRKGEAIGTFYGTQLATKCDHLPQGVDCSQFAKNDDGILVWVGDAPSTKSGWDTYEVRDGSGNVTGQRTWWGTQAPAELAIRGVRPMWGEAIEAECTDRVSGERTTYCPLGTTTPDYKLGFSNTITWKGFQIYGLLESMQGFKVYNQPLQWATFQNYAGIMDQTGKPEADQKPIGYFARLYSVSGGVAPSSYFVEDGSFVKLREVSLRYRLGADKLNGLALVRGLDGITFTAVGRNLFTWSDYNGYDPETGRGGGGTGSAALARVDGYNYPPFRTFTFGVEVNF